MLAGAMPKSVEMDDEIGRAGANGGGGGGGGGEAVGKMEGIGGVRAVQSAALGRH